MCLSGSPSPSDRECYRCLRYVLVLTCCHSYSYNYKHKYSNSAFVDTYCIILEWIRLQWNYPSLATLSLLFTHFSLHFSSTSLFTFHALILFIFHALSGHEEGTFRGSRTTEGAEDERPCPWRYALYLLHCTMLCSEQNWIVVPSLFFLNFSFLSFFVRPLFLFSFIPTVYFPQLQPSRTTLQEKSWWARITTNE